VRKFWNLPAVPVYSLVTQDIDGCFNMNCCTYVTPVSMNPKHYMVAIYHGTKTWDNLNQNPKQTVILQWLGMDQASLVRILGRQSGFSTNKIQRLERRGLLSAWKGQPVLRDAAAWAEMRSLGPLTPPNPSNPPNLDDPADPGSSTPLGDHQCWLFGLQSTRVLHDQGLDNDTLRRLGLIR